LEAFVTNTEGTLEKMKVCTHEEVMCLREHFEKKLETLQPVERQDVEWKQREEILITELNEMKKNVNKVFEERTNKEIEKLMKEVKELREIIDMNTNKQSPPEVKRWRDNNMGGGKKTPSHW